MDAILNTLSLLLVTGLVGVVIMSVRWRDHLLHNANVFVLSTLAMIVASLSTLVTSEIRFQDNVVNGTLTASFLIIAVGAGGWIALHDLIPPSRRQSRGRLWLMLCGLWLVATLVFGVTTSSSLGNAQWLVDLLRDVDAAGLGFVSGLILSGSLLLGFAFRFFYRARIAEIANRALFWSINSALLWLTALMIISGSKAIVVLGIATAGSVEFGLLNALYRHHLRDVRTILFTAFQYGTIASIATGVITLTLIIAVYGDIVNNTDGFASVLLLAVFGAAIILPVIASLVILFRTLIRRGQLDDAEITRRYSEIISEVADLEQLVPTAIERLKTILHIRSSAVILLNDTNDDSIGLLVLQPGHHNDQTMGRISLRSPLYLKLAREQVPVLQFDIEFSRQFIDMPESEKQFLRGLNMSAFAPIVPDNTMIGILAFGQRVDDIPFFSRDLALLTTLAQQTGMALRNSRLVEDLQHLNKSMRKLNLKLKSTNEQLQTMDSVKSDFVTIASHELRTPLAQLRGYTDIIDALNEQGMLDQGQTNNLVNNLRKATERMEELISAMLDVSQLDVDVMDLRFTETSLDSTVRMAIEPLTDAINQRQLSFSARGLRGLPRVQADLQRLVQAFRNVIVNAIKFTPDGGRIEVTASVQEGTGPGGVDEILIKIIDTGVGIDRANLEMIFKKFFRAYDPSLHSTGTYKFLGAGPGLGLTIARGVIEGHGGRIWAESSGHSMEEFPGSTFSILLPVARPRDDEKRVISFEGPVAEKAFDQPPQVHRMTEPKKPVTDRLKQTQIATDQSGDDV